MLIVGSDDGLYRLSDVTDEAHSTATKLRETGRVRRVRRFDGPDQPDGVFAATRDGLYHSQNGEEWTNLRVPEEKVYAVGADGDSLYAGTRPANVFVADVASGDCWRETLEWRELDGFQDLPSRSEWRLPRHENLAQVRDVHADPGAPERIVTGVEVGGVHVSEDGGETWTERRDGVHDDVHELHVVGPDEYVAGTGGGCYRTRDAGRTWARLDGDGPQSYFRSAFSHDGVIYASGALSNSSTWNDDAADPALFECHDDDSLEPVQTPRPTETVTGLTAVDGTPVAGTHRGTLLAKRSGEWTVAGEFPVTGEVTGRYTPLCWLPA